MKKIYLIPTMNVVRIELHHLMAGSEQLGFGDDVTSAEGADSRDGGSFWGDDEED